MPLLSNGGMAFLIWTAGAGWGVYAGGGSYFQFVLPVKDGWVEVVGSLGLGLQASSEERRMRSSGMWCWGGC